MTQSYGQNDTMTLGQNDITNTNVYTYNEYNNDVAEISKSFEENIGLLTPASAELIFDYLKDFSKDLIIKAIKIASVKNKRSAKYVGGILNDWNKKGFKTLADVENEQNNFNKKSEIEKTKKTDFEQREYDDLSFLLANKGGA